MLHSILGIAFLIPLARLSKIQQELLPSDYNPELPPVEYGSPVKVSVDLRVLTLRAVNEAHLSFTVDISMSHSWNDYRLKAIENDDGEDLVLKNEWKKKLWVPAFYFHDAVGGEISSDDFKRSYFKVRGQTVTMLSRVSVELYCLMSFYRYPHDSHVCNISIASLSYYINVVQMQWNYSSLSQKHINPGYNMKKLGQGSCQTSRPNFSCLSIEFLLARNAGNLIFRRYIPSVTVVIAAFVGFWIPTEAYPARVSIVVTCLLALITQQLQTSAHIRSNSIVLMTVWMNVCTTFVFLCLLEYAFAVLWQERQKLALESTRGTPVGIKNKLRRNLVDELAKLIFPLVFATFVGSYAFLA